MKVFKLKGKQLLSLRMLKKTMIFSILLGASFLMKAAIIPLTNEPVFIVNETIKMSVIPDAEEMNQAVVALYASTTKATIIVFNNQGMVAFEKSFDVELNQENSFKLDLTQLKAGTYYIVHDESNDSATFSVR